MTSRTRRLTDGGPPLAVDVHAAEAPQGAVLSIHGFASSRTSRKNTHLAAVLPALGWTVIALDLQGHGDSAGDFERLTIGRSVGDVLRAAEIPEFAEAPRRVVVGSSFGGLVATWTVVERPALADGLFLIAPAFGFLERYLDELPEDQRDAWAAGRPHRVEREEGDVVVLQRDILDELPQRDLSRLAGELACPTLVLHGSEDAAVPAAASEDFVRRVGRTDVELVVWEGADHRLTGRLHDLGELIARFVQRVGQRTSGRRS